MPGPKPGDNTNCNSKCRCPRGSYKGISFDCDEPCEGFGCVFSCFDGCTCSCNDSWTFVYTSASDADFSPCGASCTWTPTFGNIYTLTAPSPGTASASSYGIINQACGGPPYAGQTAKSVYGLDRVWNGGGWTNGDSIQIGSVADSIAFKITICEGPEEGLVYGDYLTVGGGSTACAVPGQVFIIQDVYAVIT